MASLRESINETRPWTMWVGTSADLLRLLKLVQRRYDALLKEHEEVVTAHPRRLLRMSQEAKARILAQSQDQPDDPYWANRLAECEFDIERETQALKEAEDEAAAAGDIHMTLTMKKGQRRRVDASASDLVEYLDGRYIREIDFSAPSGTIRGHDISIDVDRDRGVSLRVSSNDAQWGIAAFAELSAELDRHTPPLRYLRRPWLLGMLLFIPVSIFLWVVADSIALLTTDSGQFPPPMATLMSYVWAAASVWVTLSASALVRRYIPAFEIVAPGSPSRSRRVLNVCGTLITGLAVGIGGNFFSQFVIG